MGDGELVDQPSDEFLRFGDVIRSGLSRSRDAVSANGKEHLADLLVAHEACLACVGSAYSRPDRAVPEAEIPQKLRRATIHAAAIQGVHPIEQCISFGCYAQAAALVRQEIEAVEGLRGIRQANQPDGATPRLKALRNLGRPYGQLTGLAHLSTHALLTHIVSASIGDIDHHFNPEFSRFLFGLHVYALAGIAMDIAELRPFSESEYFSPAEKWWLANVCGTLINEGFMVL